MKIKKIGAILAGAALLGATFAAATTAADADVPDRDFFIDETTGLNNCLIVVGSGAAAADVVSAAYVAAQIGSMAYYQDVTENWLKEGVTYDDEVDVDNYIAVTGTDDDLFYDYVDYGTDPDSSYVLTYASTLNIYGAANNPIDLSAYGITSTSTPWWDYDIYVDAYTDMDGDGDEVDVDDDGDTNFLVYTSCSYEAITVDFSLRDTECTADLCISCSAACNQGLVNETRDLLECQSYPNVYARHYWGTPEVYTDSYREGDDDIAEYCDPVGGISYKTIVSEYSTYGVDENKYISWSAIIGPDSEAYEVCDTNAPTSVNLYCNVCDVYFLGTHYDALSFETDANGYDYMFYGTPNWFVEEKLEVGESKDYNGYTLTINDLNIYENKIYLTITTPEGESYDYISVINTYTSNDPTNGDDDVAVGNSGADEENDTIAFVADTFEVYTLCGNELDGYIDLDQEEVLFAVKFIKTFIGAAGTYLVEYHAYTLEDYGVLKEQIYPDECDSPITPAITVGDLEWYLDIFPGDEVDYDGADLVDLDNDIDLWESGNPNFDAADAVTIEVDGQSTAVPMLELWLATPVELAGLCEDELVITLNDCNGDNYFTLVVTDEDHTDYIIDGDIELYRNVQLSSTITKVYMDIDPESLVKLDESIDASLKNTYNLILIGGPVANTLVQELVDLEKTTFEQWENATEGDLELIEDAYAVGKDVLIVAGSDRDATANAALDLISSL